MTYTLDTNAITAALKGQQTFAERLEAALSAGHNVTLNAISYYETQRGLTPLHQRKKTRFAALLQEAEVLELDLPALDIAAEIYQTLRSAGTPLEDADILIAATAIAHNATLITRNTKHFERIEGLELDNWEDA